jgi:hypothetical protein
MSASGLAKVLLTFLPIVVVGITASVLGLGLMTQAF